MSLAATLAASGMRPASYLPTIKCSNCGDEIEISAMGEHTCSASPSSPQAAAPSLTNAFTLRQMNAMETKPAQPSPLQFSGSETKPAQPSPLQFNGNETRPAQPSPLQFTSGSPQMRPRAPTAGSAQLSVPKGSRPVLPRINPDAANQPFMGPIPPTPLSPASSIRSASSGSSKAPPKRSMTSPMPRLWDRPPSPELSANLDCAFPPFPTANNTKRKASNASQSSSRSGSRLHVSASDAPRSPLSGPGESAMSNLHPVRSAPVERSARRPSNEGNSPRDLNASAARPSPQSTPLSPLEEFPAPQGPRLAEITSLVSKSETHEPLQRVASPQEMSRTLSQKRAPPQRPPRPDEPLPAILTSGPNLMARQPSQKRIPPERPARPQEGIPESLLSPLTYQTFNARGPLSPSLPPPVPIQNADRSRTMPAPSGARDELSSLPTLSKMASEPALRYQADSTNTSRPASSPRQSTTDDDSRVDHRIRDAPPVPRSVQLHRSGSLHKSSESGTSTASSILSLGNLSLGNSNTTAGTSPVGSAAGSFDAFSPFTNSIDQELEDDSLHVAGLAVMTQQRPNSRVVEQPKENPPSRFTASPLAAEVVQPGDEHSDDDLAPPPSPGGDSWPLESPMDPALHDGKLGDIVPNVPSPIEPQQELLAPASPKLERLSNAVYDPKRPFSSQPPKEEFEEEFSSEEERTENRSRSRSSVDSFKGFNFGAAFSATTLEPSIDSAASSRKPSESAPSTTSESTPTQTPPPPPSIPEEPSIPYPPSLPSPPPEREEEANPIPSAPTLPSPPPEPSEPHPKAPPIPTNSARPGLMRRGTTGVKAACRGCRKQIEGKSVKAADGRLTGRWYKTCFVCFTCKNPFSTTDFYVINNQPYCEQHYHEKNGSLCHGCQRGIEGPFLETRSGPNGQFVRKYHRKCFTCVDCRIVLSDDYFEIAGRIHCERHALAAMRSQTRRPSAPGGPRVGSGLRAEETITTERRRSRLVGA